MAKARQPKRRIVVVRSSDNEKRRLIEPAPSPEKCIELAARTRFEGSGKHKLEPYAFGLKPARSDDDDTYCDGHAGFSPEDMPRVGRLLKRGMLAGLVGHIETKGDPTLIWTVDDNGWVYEGRITTATQALYHGYPLLSSDALAKIVIARYAVWAYKQGDAQALAALQNALERYP